MRKKIRLNLWKKVLLPVVGAAVLGCGFSSVSAQESAAEAATEAFTESFAEASTEVYEKTSAEAAETSAGADSATVEEILSSMSLDDKISQMIIPAIRGWDGEHVTELSDFPELEEALRAHQYGGLILDANNITGPAQAAALVQELQTNNLNNTEASVHIPYFMAADGEGGIVLRLLCGTRMTGNMAIGATGEAAVSNAEKTGKILGEEMAAAGFNVDFAPVVDVNNNAANPVIGTRSFSDDPERVAALGTAFSAGLSEAGVIATYKHFPGHGDTAVDSHIGTPTVEKTYDELREMELVPFAAAIEDGAEMIMTAHITYPLVDEEQVFGDGQTKGFYPATMSKKIITEILRQDLGYDGIVVTDALEMDAIRTAGLVPGELDSTEYKENVAQKVIESGIDMLLIPSDINCTDAVTFYDDYVEALKAMAEDGRISMERIDESVTRILKLKDKYGILDPEQFSDGPDLEERTGKAKEVIGSDDHHETEMEIARQVVTLVKNEEETLPYAPEGKKIVFLGHQAEDAYTVRFVLDQLKEQGILEEDARIENLALKEEEGPADADTRITIDFYYDPSADNKLRFSEKLQSAIREADLVICFDKTYSLGAMEETSVQYMGIDRAMEIAHTAGGRFVLLSDNLPYDAARYQEADAILLAYMGRGLDIDPAQRVEESGNYGAYNANVMAAIHILFGDGEPVGTLPVRIPEIETAEDGSLSYSDQILYDRGFGLKY